MNQTALITGGTRGIGLGIARAMARAGFDLALNGIRSANQVEEILDSLREEGIQVLYIPGDLSDPGVRSELMSSILKEFGKLNVLINNAGIAPAERRDILDATEESFDHVLNVNLKAPYFLTQVCARHMVEQKQQDPDYEAAIINISSISATVASVNRGEYCISKSGMSMATRLWAVRLGEFDIPVYEIRPGITETDMTAGVKQKYDQLIEDGLCVQKRWGTPEDMGKVAVSMATGNMPYATGQTVVVDGGLTIPRL